MMRPAQKPLSVNAWVEALRSEVLAMPPSMAIEYLLGTCANLIGHRDDLRDAIDNLDLSPTEALVLTIIAGRDGRVATLDYISDAVYAANAGVAGPPGVEVLRVHISRIRQKMIGSGFTIGTVWGVGYRLVERPDSAPSGRR